MKVSIFLSIATLALSASVASADVLSENPPKSTTICLDSGGRKLSVECRTDQASRVDLRENICICPANTVVVTVPICPRGVNPPGESAAYEQARLKAVDHGSLVGSTWKGQPMCVAQHRP